MKEISLVWMTQEPMGNYEKKVEDDGWEHDEWVKYQPGDKFKIKATPKEHSEYKNEKQTKISRVKIIQKL